MTAVINGVMVTGTPDEIWQLISKATGKFIWSPNTVKIGDPPYSSVTIVSQGTSNV